MRWIMALALVAAVGCSSSDSPAVNNTLDGGSDGPATNPLVGTWVHTEPSGGFDVVWTDTFNADGTLTATDVGVGTSCSGTVTAAGQWTSTATTFTMTFPTCSGTVTCGGTEVASCAGMADANCTYAISADGKSVTFDCSGDAGVEAPYTFQRQ